MFYECNKLTNINLSNFNAKNVKNMRNMFYNCRELKNIDLSSFSIQEIIEMTDMFSYCNNLAYLDLSCFNFKKAGLFSKMFVSEETLPKNEEIFKECNNLNRVKITNKNTIDFFQKYIDDEIISFELFKQ